MKRLKLTLETLDVQSFEPAEDRHAPRGTVRAHGWTEGGETCDYPSCDPNYNSCGVTYCIACFPGTGSCEVDCSMFSYNDTCRPAC